MYLLFVDESGTPPLQPKSAGTYLVVGGIIIPEGAWSVMYDEFLRIKKKYGVEGEVKWKFFGPDNKEERNSIRHLKVGERNGFRSELFKIMTSRKSVKLICCVASNEACYARPTINTQNDIYGLAYKGLSERFQYFLQDASRITSQKQYGMVICDHRMGHEDTDLRKRHNQLVHTAANFSANYFNFIETVFFSPSEIGMGLQLADLVAGAVNRSYQYGDHQFASALKPSFRSSPKNDAILGYGIVHMPRDDFVMPAKGIFL